MVLNPGSSSNRFQSLILQDVGCANTQDRHVALRKPFLPTLIVMLLSGGVVCEPIYLGRSRCQPIPAPGS